VKAPVPHAGHRHALGMNLRNHLIARYNPPEALVLAKDKARCKKLFADQGIPVPRTWFEIRSVRDIPDPAELPGEFVIKPNRGYGGHGIVVLARTGPDFRDPSGKLHRWEGLAVHIRKILLGEFSNDQEQDTALIEERLHPSPKLSFRGAAGLPDIRVVCFEHLPVMAMLRCATPESGGRANLSAGAVGMSIDLASGAITHIHAKGRWSALSRAEFGIPEPFVVPRWEEMKALAPRAAQAAGLGYAGVDLVLDRDDRVLVLEINGRPGLEIQNVNEQSLLARLSSWTSAGRGGALAAAGKERR